MSELAVQHVGSPKISRSKRAENPDQMQLFNDPAREVARILAAAKLEEMTALQAFDLVRELKAKLGK